MRVTTGTLDTAMAAQRRQAISRVTIRDMRLRFSAFTEATNPWDESSAGMPIDSIVTTAGTILRVHKYSTGDVTNIRISRVTDPTNIAQWAIWADAGFSCTDYSVGIWSDEASPTETIYLFYHVSGTIRYRTSTNDGATWSGETNTAYAITVAAGDGVGIAPVSATAVWLAYRDATGSGSIRITRLAYSGGAWAESAATAWRWYGTTGISLGDMSTNTLDAETWGGDVEWDASGEIVHFSSIVGSIRKIHIFRWKDGIFNPRPVSIWSSELSGGTHFTGWRLSKIQNRLWLTGKMTLVLNGVETSHAVYMYSDDGIYWTAGARDFYINQMVYETGKMLLSGDYIYIASYYAIYKAPSTYLIDVGDPAGKKVVLSPTDETDLLGWRLNFPPGSGTSAQGQMGIANAGRKYESAPYSDVVRAGSDLVREVGYVTSSGNEYVSLCEENIDTIEREVAEEKLSLAVTSRGKASKCLRQWSALDFFEMDSQVTHFDPIDDFSNLYILSGSAFISGGGVTQTASITDDGFLISTVPVGLRDFALEMRANLLESSNNYVGLTASFSGRNDHMRVSLRAYVGNIDIYLVRVVGDVENTIATVSVAAVSYTGTYLRWEMAGGQMRIYLRTASSTTWQNVLNYDWVQSTTPWNSSTTSLPVGIRLAGNVGHVITDLWVYDLSRDITLESSLQETAVRTGISSMSFSDAYLSTLTALTGASAGNWGTGMALTGIEKEDIDLEFGSPALSTGQRVGVSFRNSTGTWPPTDGYALWLDNTAGAYTVTLTKNALSVLETFPVWHNITGATNWRLVVNGDFFTLYLNGALIKTFHDTSNPSESSNKIVLNSYGANKTLIDVRIPELWQRIENVVIDVDRDGMAAMSEIIKDQPISYFDSPDGGLRVSRFISREDAGTYGDEVFVEQLSPTDFEVATHIRVYSEDIVDSVDEALAQEHGWISRSLQMPTLSTAETYAEAARSLVRAGELYNRRRIELTGQLRPEVEDTIALSYTTPAGYVVSETVVVMDESISYDNDGSLSLIVGGRKEAG